jgi:hypothetical protein
MTILCTCLDPILTLLCDCHSLRIPDKLFHVAFYSYSLLHLHLTQCTTTAKRNIFCLVSTSFGIFSFISYFGSNLYGSRGTWVAYSLICRQNKEDSKKHYVLNRELVIYVKLEVLFEDIKTSTILYKYNLRT